MENVVLDAADADLLAAVEPGDEVRVDQPAVGGGPGAESGELLLSADGGAGGVSGRGVVGWPAAVRTRRAWS